MTDHDALLAAVLADPAADLPRLVYADYLEETGHPAHAARAHFIRHQIEAERLPNPSPERTAHERAADELFVLHRAGWVATLPEWVTWDSEVRFRRGFVDGLVTTPRRFFRDGHELLAVAPVMEVQIRNRTAGYPRVRALTTVGVELSRVTSLRIGPGYELNDHVPRPGEEPDHPDEDNDPPAVFLFRELRTLTAVRRLTMSGNRIDDGWLVRLVSRLPKFAFAPAFRELDLSDNPISDAGACTLYAARGLDQLDCLDLTRSRITPNGPAELLLRRRFGDRVVL